MVRRKTMKILFGTLLCAAVCTGCVPQTAESLYALPKQSDEYYQLQSAIDGVMGHDAVYAGPLTGSNQQAVQLADLDGDGRNEAIAFVRTTGEKPLKFYIFDETADGSYENTAAMEGDGSAFDSVEYVQLDEQPGLEILVGRRLSDQILQSLSAHSYENGTLSELMSTNYTEYTVADLDSDDRRDVFVLRLESEGDSTAELYRYRQGELIRGQEADLSKGAGQVKRMVAGYVSPDVPAVFVASSYGEDTIVTDIFAFRDGQFCNVAANAQTGVSAQTVRSCNVYASDIDSDGLIELPTPVALPSAHAQDQTQWVIDWYNLLPNGEKQVKLTTYHNYQTGWYLEIPETWRDRLTVFHTAMETGMQGNVFAQWNGRDAEAETIFTLYVLSGEDRMEQAQTDGRFLLAEKGETVYAAELGTCSLAKTLNQELLRAMFHFIQVDWNSGEL